MIERRALHRRMFVAAGLGALALAAACGIDAVGLARDADADSADGAAPGSLPDGRASDADGGAEAGGGADGGDAGPIDPCAAEGGPAMVRIDAGFCIDTTEVTNAEYAAFFASLDGGSDAGDVPSFCAWKTSYRPSTWTGSPPTYPAGGEELPVHAVDFCDAWMFCRWAGKRLCGTLDGQPTPPAEAADAQASAWTYACSAGGARVYPYGASYVASACNTDDIVGDPEDVGSFSGCQGGYPGIFDMSGNAWEWDDSCEPGGPTASCHVRGGSVARGEDEVRCTTAVSTPRNDNAGNNGIRCCKY